MKKVAERMGYDILDDNFEDDIRQSVSGYAYQNKGIKHDANKNIISKDEDYGVNTEWLAESVADARNSPNPAIASVFAKEELEKLMKEANLI